MRSLVITVIDCGVRRGGTGSFDPTVAGAAATTVVPSWSRAISSTAFSSAGVAVDTVASRIQGAKPAASTRTP